ncbi:MAG: GHMP kinase [Candidatus Bathyarchaeota archaeon]|nr:GHMP kinase [Candidatus Bathyarchaeota archaeon]
MNDSVAVSSPGRADFLNTHQDYKGLPVVPAAINLRTRLFAEPRRDRVFNVKSLDLEQYDEPSTDTFGTGKNELLDGKFFGNYLRSVVNILAELGLARKLRGMDVTIKSEIPVGSGLSSSAALQVGFAELLNHACNLGLTKRELAEIAFAAETREMGVPCGRLDQYGVAFGGIIKLEGRPPYRVELLPFKDLTFAIADSGVRHSTGGIHPKRQADINRGLKALMESRGLPEPLKENLGYRFNEPIWEEIAEEDLKDFLSLMDDKARRRILFTLRMQRLTEFALKILRLEEIRGEQMSPVLGAERWRNIKTSSAAERRHRVLGEVMNDQHALLRDLYDVSLPAIEDVCAAALEAGAYGAKISGAGMGGSIIALVKNRKEGKKVIDACLSSGAQKGWVSKVEKGVKVEPTFLQKSR